EVDEPEAEIVPVVESSPVLMGGMPMAGDDDQPETGYERITEDDLLRGLEGLVPPDRSDDY
ncbi:MAG: DNA-directed RNA polymerase subunit omega, partial [Hyphomicrobiales bacterium]